MADTITVTINGQAMEVSRNSTVAAAVLHTRISVFRRSLKGEPRGPLCGMGICFECRVAIDGHLHQRSCQTICRPGMQIDTG